MFIRRFTYEVTKLRPFTLRKIRSITKCYLSLYKGILTCIQNSPFCLLTIPTNEGPHLYSKYSHHGTRQKCPSLGWPNDEIIAQGRAHQNRELVDTKTHASCTARQNWTKQRPKPLLQRKENQATGWDIERDSVGQWAYKQCLVSATIFGCPGSLFLLGFSMPLDTLPYAISLQARWR